MAKFFKDVKARVFVRQKGVCAQCGFGLNELIEETEMNSMHFHHVQPQALGGGNDEDNCVVLCSDTYRKAKDSCHYHVHEEGNYRGKVVAGPDTFSYSHGHESANHMAWVLRWRKIYGQKEQKN
ncbi:HNH endonuclease [Roseateles albus]|uniref:HNH endonuclease n=1 Tax=Roseateles albus TaxID=2987525 RepID=A0ABT5KDY2_9BURK|nr:HNH endonuclease [Roseateles albus]MDC8771739.1 HNH endonuclease [Roseateles albus]